MAKKREQRFLLLDDRNIDVASNMKLSVGTAQKHPANPLFIEDKPWEQRFDNLYGNILFDQDEQMYKCWYSPFIKSNRCLPEMSLQERRATPYEGLKNMEMGICYAISRDGLSWLKPDLGLVEYDGNKHNNLVWRGPHGAGILKDGHETDPMRRYKTIFQGINISTSSDGLKWARPHKVECHSAGDTHNNALWSEELGKYVAFTRTWAKTDRPITGMESKTNHGWSRQVSRMESSDFLNWSDTEVVIEGSSWEKQPYAMPVFKHAGIYLGLIAIHDQVSDRVWTELAWSPDTIYWRRIDEGNPLIGCSETELEYDYGCVYACLSPVFLRDEVRLYYGGSDWLHFDWRTGCLALATLRPDGFAGFKQIDTNKPGKLTTMPVDYTGQQIRVTLDVAALGSVSVKVLDSANAVVGEQTFFRSVTDAPLFIDESLTTEIRLEFSVTAATVYSFVLDNGPES